MTSQHEAKAKATRQNFNVAIGYLGVVLGAILAVTGWWGTAGWGFVSAGVVLAVLSYCVMARPYIRFEADHVVISNVLRETTIPWSGVSHATSRGTLALYDVADARTTVWAIGAQKPRTDAADGDSPLPAMNPGSWRPDPSSLVAAPHSARALCEGINAETIDNQPAPNSGRVVRWLPLPCALYAFAAIVLILGFVL